MEPDHCLDWNSICRNKPHHWSLLNFGAIFSERTERGAIDLPLLSVTIDGLKSQEETERRDTSNEDKSKYKVVRQADIVYNTMRMWQGRSGYVTMDGLVSPAYTVITPKAELEAKYASYLLKFPPLVRRFCADSQGLVSDTWNLKFRVFASIKAPLPPLPEQRKIAAILSSVDDAILATQAVIEQTRRVKEGLLQELLTRGFGHTRFKQTEIGEIPEEWEVRRLADVAVPNGTVGGPFGSDLTSADYVRLPGVPVIRGGNVSPGVFCDDGFVFVSDEKAETLRKNTARPGDLIMTQRGCSLGQAALIPDDMAYRLFVVSQTMMGMTPNKDCIRPGFLAHYVNGPASQEWLRRQETATGQPHLNLTTFRRMPIVIPTLAEQAAIESKFDRLDAVIRSNELQVASNGLIKAGLLQDLLTGKVRVAV